MLEAQGASPAAVERWRQRVGRMREALGWPEAATVAIAHRDMSTLAFVAPADRLLAATELNEWAWIGAADLPAPLSPAFPSPHDFESACETLRAMASAESDPRLLALQAEAQRRGLPCLVDDEVLSLGAGEGSASWPIDRLPAAPDWSRLHDVPTALVTGSNGKTTTVRLVAAMLSASGLRTGFNCTDGVFVDGQALQSGDYSGPAGARAVLRDLRVQAAVLETARGGLLRRGLAVRHAHAAIVTNVSADHFGEYGVDSLEDLAEAKLVVARALGAADTLVLNADDALLRQRGGGRDCRLAWFSTDADSAATGALLASGADTCAWRDGRLVLQSAGDEHDLGAMDDMPLAFGGAARYNLANLAGAAMLGFALGIAPAVIAAVLSRFGGSRSDNPGRLERWRIGGAWVLLDYAHNPEGLQGLLDVARGLVGAGGRLGLLLGQAGNREDAAIAGLARVAASAAPSRVLLKDIDGYLRGRAPGEVAALIRAELLKAGVREDAIAEELSEVEAARELVGWAGEGDVVVLPVHNLQARETVARWLDAGATGSIPT